MPVSQIVSSISTSTAIITSSSNDGLNNYIETHETLEHQDFMYRYGVPILQDVLSDAGRLIDCVLQPQTQSDETLGQLYGTIMSPILPSILLLYGIAFCKHRCVMLGIVPDVSKLLKKLQLIGKSANHSTFGFNTLSASVVSNTASLNVSAADKKHSSESLNGSIRNTMSHIGTSISHAIDTATHPTSCHPTVKEFTPISVHSDVEFVPQVCCGYYHTLLLSNSGVVAGFSRNDYGQVN